MKVNKKMKKIRIITLLFLFIAVITFAILYNGAISKPLKSNEKTVSVKVKAGDGFYDVLNRLDDEGKLHNKLLIKVKLSIDKQNITLKEGTYEINSDVTLEQLIKDLQDDSYNINMIKVTIPEGYSVEEIAELMEEKGLCSKNEFIEAIKNYELPTFVEVNEKRRYNLDKMLERFNTAIKEIEKENNIVIKNEDIDKIITIASMIEKEASEDIDRPLISSVIYNRLEKGMKLQLDATVLYALGEHVDVVLNRHLEVDSPYNTYKYSGLPIGPIASPGIECIKAALLPAKTDNLYYILQKDGTHYFTKSYEDFLAKKKELGY